MLFRSPIDLKVYGGLESKRFASFNEAVDEYFSAREFERGEESLESGFRKEREKFERRLSEQEKVLSKAYEDAEVLRNKGDALFQRMHELEPLLAEIKALRKKGLSDEEVLARIRERTIVKDLKKTELTLEL